MPNARDLSRPTWFDFFHSAVLVRLIFVAPEETQEIEQFLKIITYAVDLWSHLDQGMILF